MRAIVIELQLVDESMYRLFFTCLYFYTAASVDNKRPKSAVLERMGKGETILIEENGTGRNRFVQRPSGRESMAEA